MDVLAGLVLVGSQWFGSNIRLHDGSRFDVFWPCPLPVSALHYTHLSALLSSCSTFVFIAGRMPFPSCLCLFTYFLCFSLRLRQAN